MSKTSTLHMELCQSCECFYAFRNCLMTGLIPKMIHLFYFLLMHSCHQCQSWWMHNALLPFTTLPYETPESIRLMS